MARTYSIPGLWTPRPRDASRIWMPGDECARGPCQYSPGVGAGTFANQRILDYQHIFGPQLLGVYQLYGPGLVPSVTVIDSPNDFSANPPWVPTQSSVPSAHVFREDATPAGLHLVHQVVANATGPVNSFGCTVGPDGRDWVLLRLVGGGDAYTFFNVTTGAVGTSSGGTAAMVAAGGGLYTCTVTPTPGTVFNAGAQFRIYSAVADGSFFHNGDITKGLQLYNATIDQTSILTAPNDPVLAARNQSLYGDPFHATYATKAGQPVVGATAWNGLPAAIFSGANLLTIDAMGAMFSGSDKPAAVLISAQWTGGAAAAERLWSMGNSAGGSRQFDPYRLTGKLYLTRFDDAAAGKTLTGTIAQDASRHVHGHLFTGTTGTEYQDGVAGASADLDVGTVTFDQVTIGALRRAATEKGWFGPMREVVFVMSATPAQMLAASALMRARNQL